MTRKAKWPSTMTFEELPMGPFTQPTRHPAQRESAEDARINGRDFYLCQIYGELFGGRFQKVWYGWSFAGWVSPAGIQLDMIERVWREKNNA